jgi:hypothetical protein
MGSAFANATPKTGTTKTKADKLTNNLAQRYLSSI